jgi:hypothetical protein
MLSRGVAGSYAANEEIDNGTGVAVVGGVTGRGAAGIGAVGTATLSLTTSGWLGTSKGAIPAGAGCPFASKLVAGVVATSGRLRKGAV